LLHAWFFGFDNIIPKQNREWFIADKTACTVNRVPQAFWLFLPDIMYVCQIGYGADLFEYLRFPGFFKLGFQFISNIEMILDCPLSPAGNDDYIFNSGINRFFHNILNGWFVYNWQHFFWC